MESIVRRIVQTKKLADTDFVHFFLWKTEIENTYWDLATFKYFSEEYHSSFGAGLPNLAIFPFSLDTIIRIFIPAFLDAVSLSLNWRILISASTGKVL